MQAVAGALFSLSAGAYVWFGASLRAALGKVDDRAERLGSLAHANTVLIATGLCIYASFGQVAVQSVGDVPASVTKTFLVLNGEGLYVLLAVGTTLLVLPTAISVLRHGGLPRWFGWVCLILGAVAVVVLVVGAFVPGLGFVAFLLLVVWVPTAAILIYRFQPITA